MSSAERRLTVLEAPMDIHPLFITHLLVGITLGFYSFPFYLPVKKIFLAVRILKLRAEVERMRQRLAHPSTENNEGRLE